MKINYKKILSGLLSIFILFPLISLAVTPAYSIQNPLGNNDLKSLLDKIMNIVTVFGSIVVVMFIIYSGFKFVTARGNEGELKKAKEIFYATIIGAAILLGARVIAEIVVGTVESTTGLKIDRNP